MGWTCGLRWDKNTFIFLVRKPPEKQNTSKIKMDMKDNIKVDVRDRRWALVRTAINILVS
jgi:hypothetical protein